MSFGFEVGFGAGGSSSTGLPSEQMNSKQPL